MYISINEEVRIMAIYHFSAQVISRGRGQSAVASAAYRSGDRLTDERTGEEKFYRRDVEPNTMILAPSNSPEWVNDRERLWNEVEQIEKRKDAQLAREINIALPVELSNDLQKKLIHNYIQKEFVDKGMIADIAIHRDDQENPHAHVMLTTRTITSDGFGPKNRDWNNKELLKQWREEWSTHANKALEHEGVQDRISHLSHEDRGLEQLPTIHLGHVAHEMEKRGVATDRGNINRDRQEYNCLVIDLQKYREEKKALEQEKARKQAENKKLERFTTAAERVNIQKASQLLETKPSLSKIAEKQTENNNHEEQILKNNQSFHWKDQKIKEASKYFHSINLNENKIQEAQQRINTINWLNPLKINENRRNKEQALKTIATAKEDIKFNDEKLNHHRKILSFSTEKEFNKVKVKHETETPNLLKKNQNDLQQIQYEQEVLKKAENVLKNAFVRQIASTYPERPEVAYLSFSNAQKLNQLNQKQGRIVPIETIEKVVNNSKQEIQRLQVEIIRTDQYQSRLLRAAKYLEDYEKYDAIKNKYENNPLLKGKMLVSKSAKREYDSTITARNSYKELMKREGITERTDFEKQKNTLEKMKPRIPEFQEQIQSHEKGLRLLDTLLKGIEEAGREMQWEQKQQQQKIQGKHNNKNRDDLYMGR